MNIKCKWDGHPARCENIRNRNSLEGCSTKLLKLSQYAMLILFFVHLFHATKPLEIINLSQKLIAYIADFTKREVHQRGQDARTGIL